MTNTKLIEIINYIEEKDINIQNSWFFHGTSPDIETIEQILKEGIKSSYLRKEKSNGGYNGKYYVSVSKVLKNSEHSVYKLFEHLPIFVLDNINPLPAKRHLFDASWFMNSIIPIRYSVYDGEYHNFFKISPSKIVALAYNLSFQNLDVERLQFLKRLVLCIEKNNLDLPIYDLSSKKEVNKEKVHLLKLD